MEPVYFCITENPDPALFDAGWVEIPGGRLVLDRTVWRGDAVSRSRAHCVALRADPDYGAWEVKNMAEGRVVVLTGAQRRYDLVTGMGMTLRPGTWKGTLTGAFTFVVTSVRPHARIRVLGSTGALQDTPDDTTARRGPVVRAAEYLGKHPVKRMALAHLWRQHLGHTRDLAEDLTSAEVGRAFGVPASTVTGWREELATYVYGERGHQTSIRDLVLKHGLLTRRDVEDADTWGTRDAG